MRPYSPWSPSVLRVPLDLTGGEANGCPASFTASGLQRYLIVLVTQAFALNQRVRTGGALSLLFVLVGSSNFTSPRPILRSPGAASMGTPPAGEAGASFIQCDRTRVRPLTSPPAGMTRERRPLGPSARCPVNLAIVYALGTVGGAGGRPGWPQTTPDTQHHGWGSPRRRAF